MIEYIENKNVHLHENYVYTRTLQLDLKVQKRTAELMKIYILNSFDTSDTKVFNGQKTLTTGLYSKYNYLMYPRPGIHELYNEIKNMFHDISGNGDKKNYIQCWLNFYYKGEYIDWHGHYPKMANSWHGFYCIDVEPNSHTSYKVDRGDEFIIPSRNNLLVLSPSGRDKHKSSCWEESTPRITVAFDIVPMNHLYDLGDYRTKNHWIPI